MPAYFSDRQRGPRPRTNEIIEPSVWGGIYAIVSALLSNGSFGCSFPENCPDGYGVIGHDSRALELMLKAQHPDMPYSLPLDDTPDTLAARVFAAECIAYPEALRWIAEGRVEIDGRKVRVLSAT